MSIETCSVLFLLKRYSSNTTMKCKQKVLRIPVLHAWRTQLLFMSQTFQTKLWTIHISQFSPLPLISDSLPRLLIIYFKCNDFSSTLVYVTLCHDWFLLQMLFLWLLWQHHPGFLTGLSIPLGSCFIVHLWNVPILLFLTDFIFRAVLSL